MRNPISWLRAHKYETHLAAFVLMLIPPLPMYLAAQYNAAGWIWFLLGFVILGNLLALILK